MATPEPMRAPVSVIIPCFRNAATIERAVQSALQQTMPPAELLIVDDASDDNTPEILHTIQQTHGADRVSIITLKENSGPAAARNAGWDAATQPFIAFLDADDSWHPEKISRQHAFMQATPEAMLSGHASMVLESDAPPMTVGQTSVTRMSSRHMLSTNPFVTPSAMLRNTPDYRFHGNQHHMEDYLLWLQIYLDGHPVFMLNATLAYLHKPFGASGLSAETWNMQKANMANWWLLRRQQRISFGLACVLSVYSTLKCLRRIALDACKGLLQKRKLL